MAHQSWRTVVWLVILCAPAPAVAADPLPGRQPPANEQRIRRLIIKLGSDHFADREEAGKQLVASGPSALALLRRAAASSDKEVARRARACIADIETNAKVTAIAARLNDRSPHVRVEATNALLQIGPAARESVPALIRVLADEDPGVRVQAVIALAHIGRSAQAAVPTLLRLLKDRHSDAELRWAVAMNLARIVSRLDEAVPALLDMLSDEKPLLRNAAAYGLADFGRDDRRVVPALLKALRDPHPAVQSAAGVALGRIGREATTVVPALVNALKRARGKPVDRRQDPRGGILWGLEYFGPDAAPGVPVLLDLVQDRNDFDFVRSRAILVLQHIGPAAQAAAPTLRGFVRQGQFSQAAATALRAIEQPSP